MASLLRNIARKNFVNFLEVLKARRLVSFGQTFIKGDNVLRVPSNLSAFIHPRKRESHRKQRRNFPYTLLFAVLGIDAATSNNTEEDSLPTSSVSQSLSVTTSSSPSHHVNRSANGRFAIAGKGTSNKMALMQQGYRNYMAKRKLNFKNITDENEPPSKRNPRSTQVSTAVTLYLEKNFVKSTKQAFMLIIGNIKSLCLKQAAAEKAAGLPHGTRLIDLDTFQNGRK